METITNIASTATETVSGTVSNIIYGEQAKTDKTAGREPRSGELGEGTATDPYDHGNLPTPFQATDMKTFLDYSSTTNDTTKAGDNDFLKLNPVLGETQSNEATSESATTAEADNVGLPVLTMNPDTAVSGTNTATESSTSGVQAGATNQVWKETPLDDVSRAGAPGAGPAAAELKENPANTDTSTNSAGAVRDSSPAEVIAKVHDKLVLDSKKHDEAAKTSAPGGVLTGDNPVVTADQKGFTGSTSSGPALSDNMTESTSSNAEEKTSKMSHLKEKLKDKLHIGSKDK